MPLSSDAALRTQIAFQRFGLGANPGGPSRIGTAPEAAVRAEVRKAGIAAISDSTLPSYAQACASMVDGNQTTLAFRQRELAARINKHLTVEIGFVERLVLFWSNHFSMAGSKKGVRGVIGQWERDVIRKHVLGRFSDMLRATIRHPGMIVYLDNDGSVGPGSVVGYQKRVSYTENLAREILDLHTVGSGNYTEASVAALAKMLTGWSVARKDPELVKVRGQFLFRKEWHEQGPIEFMGRVYADEGVLQADRVLAKLCELPATAEKIAFKLVRHFICDEPTAAMVAPLKQAFLRTGGDLQAVSLALLDLPEAWSAPLTKMRTPYELSIAQFRALDTRLREAQISPWERMLAVMHYAIWEPPSPEGFSDDSKHWLTPDGMAKRVDSALFAANAFADALQKPVEALALSLYDRALSGATRERIAHAGEQADALTILFSSPEFQRR